MSCDQAIQVNPFVVNDRSVVIHIAARGSDLYWAVMSSIGFAMLSVMTWSFMKPAQ